MKDFIVCLCVCACFLPEPQPGRTYGFVFTFSFVTPPGCGCRWRRAIMSRVVPMKHRGDAAARDPDPSRSEGGWARVTSARS